MAFFENLGQKISSAGQNVAQQTKNLTEVTRLNSQVSSLEKQITELYTAIGRAYYEASKDAPAIAAEEVQKVNEMFAQIAEAKERIKEIRGVGKCPQCGADVPQGAQFCSACGCKIEQPKPEEKPGKPVCSNCGAVLEPGSLFCTSCGHKVEKEEEPAPEAKGEDGPAD